MSTTTAGRCVSPSSRGDRHDPGTRDRTTAGSPSEGETWHNWIIRLVEDGVAVGFVEATVTDVEADIACLIGVDLQGRGFATEAATAMIEWLVAGGTRRMVAHIHPDHPPRERWRLRSGWCRPERSISKVRRSGSVDHIRKTPKRSVPLTSAEWVAERAMPSTCRLSRGSMSPSSRTLAVEK